jgi:hypothetical protein
MEADANAFLGEVEQIANVLGPAGAGVAKAVSVAATAAVIVSNVDLSEPQGKIKKIYNTIAKPVSTNPHGDGSYSLEISGDPSGQIGVPGLETDPVLDKGSGTLGNGVKDRPVSDIPTFEKIEDIPVVTAAQTEVPTEQILEKISEQSGDMQATENVREQKETTFIASASELLQDFVQSGIEESRSDTKVRLDNVAVDRTWINLYSKHPDQFLVFINRELSQRYSVPIDELKTVVKKLHLHKNGDVEVEFTREYAAHLDWTEQQKQKAIFNRAVVNVGSDLEKIRNIVATSGSLHKQLKKVSVPRELVEDKNFTFVGVTVDGKRVYRSDNIHVYQKITHLTGTSHACRNYVVEVTVDSSGKTETCVRYLDQVSDAGMIKPDDSFSIHSTCDVSKKNSSVPLWCC